MLNFIKKIKKINLPFFLYSQIYFDLGTCTTRIAIKDKGVVYREPTYLGFNKKTKEYIFFGKDAKTILGKAPSFLKISRPVINGIISHFDGEVVLIKKALEKSIYPYYSKFFLKPPLNAIASVPSVATQIEQKAVEEALLKAGCSTVKLIEKPIATAAGCNLNVFSHKPNLIIDLGGGLIEMAIISSGGIINHKTLKNGGNYLNKLIYNYIYLKYGVILGETTCENLKINILSFGKEDKNATIKGKSLESGLPKSIRIKTADIKEAVIIHLNQIIDGVKELIETSAPETIEEIYKRGIILSGGIANVKDIDVFFSKELKIDTICTENPEDATIRGIIKIAKSNNDIDKLLMR